MRSWDYLKLIVFTFKARESIWLPMFSPNCKDSMVHKEYILKIKKTKKAICSYTSSSPLSFRSSHNLVNNTNAACLGTCWKICNTLFLQSRVNKNLSGSCYCIFADAWMMSMLYGLVSSEHHSAYSTLSQSLDALTVNDLCSLVLCLSGKRRTSAQRWSTSRRRDS